MKDKKKEEFVWQHLDFLGRSSTRSEETEWQRREDLRRAVLDNPGNTVSNDTATRNTSHVSNLQTQPCWLCAENVSVYRATRSLDGLEEKDRRCPTCDIRLEYTVPFFAGFQPWYWSRPKDMTVRETYDVLLSHGTIWLNERSKTP